MPCGNTVNFLHTSQVHFCFKNTLKNAIQTNGEKSPKPPLPLWGMWTPSNTPMPEPTTHQTTARSVQTFTDNYTTKSPLVTMGCPTLIPKTAACLRRSPPQFNTPILRLNPITTPNGIQIQSAIFPQFIHQAD